MVRARVGDGRKSHTRSAFLSSTKRLNRLYHRVVQADLRESMQGVNYCSHRAQRRAAELGVTGRTLLKEMALLD